MGREGADVPRISVVHLVVILADESHAAMVQLGVTVAIRALQVGVPPVDAVQVALGDFFDRVVPSRHHDVFEVVR